MSKEVDKRWRRKKREEDVMRKEGEREEGEEFLCFWMRDQGLCQKLGHDEGLE